MPQHKHGRTKSGVQPQQQHQHQLDNMADLGEGAVAKRPANPPLPDGQVYCCVPMGCHRLHNAPITVADPGDAVKVACNNENCTEGTWMHAECFSEWQDHVLAYLRSCGRARSWSERQRLQNLWTKKGYDLAYKACDCKCGRGHLRKDLDYFPTRAGMPRGQEDKKGKKHKKKTEKPLAMLNKATGGLNYHLTSQGRPIFEGANGIRPQLRVRTSSFSSTGSVSPPSSAGTPPLTPSSGSGGSGTSKKSQFEFFVDPGHAAAGNIFRRRTDFSVFNVLPRHQQNPYHIKMEDEGPHGNDETRCFVLTNLSTHQVTAVRCVVCSHDMPVFDKYPLIDGTFFLSPQRYNSDLMVLADHRMLYMNAVCMKCLDGGRQTLQCRSCRSPWLGSAFVIGSMYAYDIFAAMPCCARRLSCKNCHGGIIDPGCAFQFFSEYSKLIQCPHCKVEDFHFIKPLEDCFTAKPHIRNF